MFISFFNYFLKFVLDFYNIIYFKIIKNTYLLMLWNIIQVFNQVLSIKTFYLTKAL